MFNLNNEANTSVAAHSKASSLGPDLLKVAGTASTVKHKEAPLNWKSKGKKRKTAVDQIIEFEVKKERIIPNRLRTAVQNCGQNRNKETIMSW